MRTQQEIDKLKTLQESFNELVGLYEGLVPRENVLVRLSVPNDTFDWSDYSIIVTNADGTIETYDIQQNGEVEFSVPYNSVYTIQMPVLPIYIAPTNTYTFTAQKPVREIKYSYKISGVFGIDAEGRYYSISQIKAMSDTSSILYCGYTDEHLENSLKEDGSRGNGLMWILGSDGVNKVEWASQKVEFSTELLPFITTVQVGKDYCDGESYTQYVLSEGVRLGVVTPAASWATAQTIIVGGKVKHGFLESVGQQERLMLNKTTIMELYSACGLNTQNAIFQGTTCNQFDAITYPRMYSVSNYYNEQKTVKAYTNVFFSLD